MDINTNMLIWERHPSTHDALMIAAFQGWNDGGSAASNAVKLLIKVLNAERFASIDPEDFYVFSESRPTVTLVEGNSRQIDWQENIFYVGKLPGSGRDVVLFIGNEPQLKWKTFSSHMATVALQQNVTRVVTLGAFLADVLYTLPVQVNGFSSDVDMEAEHGLSRSNYEGPTGIVGILSDYCRQQNLPTMSLWAAVPYYISIPNPKAVQALVSKLQMIFGFQIEMQELEADVDEFDNEINDVVAKDPSVAAYVRELKKREFLN